MLRSFVTALAILAACPANAQSWSVGTEREVDEGFYMKLVYSQNGWRVWRTETRDGVRCKAVKSAKGRPHPQPLGVNDTLWMGSPYLTISRGYQDKVSIDLVGRWGYGGEWRDVGAKFWEDDPDYQDLTIRDGRSIEVHTQTWEYNAIKVGLADERGIIDLTGFDAAVAEFEACDSKVQVPKPRDPTKPAIKSLGYLGYPSDAIRAKAEGRVRYVATISPEGRAIDCRVIEPLELESMNLEACKVVMGQRTSFYPAMDESGQPIAAAYEGTVVFSMQ